MNKAAALTLLHDGSFIGDEVPIRSQFRVYSYKGSYRSKEIKSPWRMVQQSLVVMKNTSSKATETLLKSRIKRHGLKASAKFTGYVLLSKLATGDFVSVENSTNRKVDIVEISTSGMVE